MTLTILIISALYMAFMTYVFDTSDWPAFFAFKALPFLLTLALMFLVGMESGIVWTPE